MWRLCEWLDFDFDISLEDTVDSEVYTSKSKLGGCVDEALEPCWRHFTTSITGDLTKASKIVLTVESISSLMKVISLSVKQDGNSIVQHSPNVSYNVSQRMFFLFPLALFTRFSIFVSKSSKLFVKQDGSPSWTLSIVILLQFLSVSVKSNMMYNLLCSCQSLASWELQDK